MESTKVEFLRFFDLKAGMLIPDWPYLVASGNDPIKTVKVGCWQDDINKLLNHSVNYANEESERIKNLNQVGDIVYDFLSQSIKLNKRSKLQQIDLVLNPAELAALPFEAARYKDRSIEDNNYVLTRRVRGAYKAKKVEWRYKPRILFVWSEDGGRVPHEAHYKSLEKILDQWYEDGTSRLTHIQQATLQDIEDELDRGAKADNPYTHLHVLAHGKDIKDSELESEYQLCLNGGAVDPTDFARSLVKHLSSLSVVTLAACDIGRRNSLIPKEPLAHKLHLEGVPIVIASQFPFTQDGSEVMTSTFYSTLLQGEDVRFALHETRKALAQDLDTYGHDWLSLVGYVSLHEGYEDYLVEYKNKITLIQLKNVQAQLESAVEAGDTQKIAQLSDELEDHVKRQKKYVSKTKNYSEEIIGNLGSAEKRLAESLFHLGTHMDSPEKLRESRLALKRSQYRYRSVYKSDVFSHWTGLQVVCLDLVLMGKIKKERWQDLCRVAEVARKKENEYWAQGTLVELWVIGDGLGLKPELTLETYLKQIKQRSPTLDPFISLRRQLNRYCTWWTKENGYLPGFDDIELKKSARFALNKVEAFCPE